MSESLDIEAAIEDALIALLKQEQFIKDGDFTVLPWRNTKEVDVEQLAIVHAKPAEPDLKDKKGRAITWKVKCDLTGWSHVDVADAGVGLYQFLLGFANAIDQVRQEDGKSQLDDLNVALAPSGVKIDGPFPANSDYTSYGESFKGRIVSFEFSATST